MTETFCRPINLDSRKNEREGMYSVLPYIYPTDQVQTENQPFTNHVVTGKQPQSGSAWDFVLLLPGVLSCGRSDDCGKMTLPNESNVT